MRRRFHIIVFALICLLPMVSNAQPYPGNNNKMLVDEIKGCAPFSFTVTHGSCVIAGDCAARFRDPNTNAVLKTVPFQSGNTLTQDDPGPFILEIIAASSVNNDDLLLTAIDNIKPSFEVYSCQNGSIQVKITDLQYDHYKINGAGPEATQDQNDPPFEYGFPMPYPANAIIRVRGVNDGMADNCADSVKTVRVASIPAANISAVTVLNANAVEITHDGVSSVQYRLMAATNSNSPVSYQLAKTVYDSPGNIETISSILPDVNYYCFRLDIFSPCNNQTIINPNVVCSINFDAVAQNNYNALSWTTGPGATGEALTRDGVSIPLTTMDNNVSCNVPYRYQLTANFGSAISTSLEKTVTAISTTPPFKVENISTVVDGSQVVIDWQQPAGFTASSYVLRKIVGPDSGPIANLNALTFTDNAYVPQACYAIAYDDVCGNASGASAPACPIVLTHALHDDNTIDLWWTPYQGWYQGVDYYEIYQDGTLIDSPTNAATSAAPYKIPNDAVQQVHQYRVVAYPKEATAPPIVVSASNMVEVVKAPNLFYPQAFVPGSAFTENAKFKVFSQFTEHIEFKIFNRWGELMFYTTDLDSDGWDGTYKGTPMPEGTYVFTAKITDFAGRTFDRSGTIVLLRKNR